MRIPAAEGDLDDFYRSPGQVDLDGRGSAWAEWLEDLARYRAHHEGSLLKPLLLEQALYALLVYRVNSAIYRSDLPRLPKALLQLVGVAAGKVSEVITGVTLVYWCDIAPGQYIGHYGPTLIGANVGAGCNFAQGVSIGVAGRGEQRGIPSIGKYVFVGANATIAGDITIGDGAVIAANSFVTKDVPANHTAIGVPARVLPGDGTKGLGLHQRPLHRRKRG
jgi:serine O-acetyltransferase